MTPPCKDCTSRHIGCHGGCEAYQTWQKANYERLHPAKEESTDVRYKRNSLKADRFRPRGQ